MEYCLTRAQIALIIGANIVMFIIGGYVVNDINMTIGCIVGMTTFILFFKMFAALFTELNNNH
jgi:hypothetical protein